MPVLYNRVEPAPSYLITYLQTWTSGCLLSSGNLSKSRISESGSEARQQGLPHSPVPRSYGILVEDRSGVKGISGEEYPIPANTPSKKLIRALYKFWVLVPLPETKRVPLHQGPRWACLGLCSGGGSSGNFSNLLLTSGNERWSGVSKLMGGKDSEFDL